MLCYAMLCYAMLKFLLMPVVVLASGSRHARPSPIGAALKINKNNCQKKTQRTVKYKFELGIY